MRAAHFGEVIKMMQMEMMKVVVLIPTKRPLVIAKFFVYILQVHHMV
jgi:hypothetical protein